MQRDPRKGMPPAGERRGIPWEAVIGRDDKNKDGKVSQEEFSGPPLLFKLVDKNGDGILEKSEHEAFVSRPGLRP